MPSAMQGSSLFSSLVAWRMWVCAHFLPKNFEQHGQYTTYEMGLITREGLLVAIG
jgi:hypothetical protein